MTPDMRCVVNALKGKRLPLHDEKECQKAIASVFDDAIKNGWFTREVRIAGGVIDFIGLCGTGVEVKLKGTANDIRRQLVRYAADDRIKGLVLVTAAPVGVTNLLRGKPVTEFDIGRAWL